ncbi:MAG: DUF6807 family protein, partial [Acidobacteriota bacterium]
MKKLIFSTWLAGLVLTTGGAIFAQAIKIVEQKEKKQLDVYVDKQLFTSYCYWDSQKKPILYPLQTANGTVVTRSYPVAKVAGERTDHPHHVSAWFNYGNINGVDFWNNSGGKGSEKMGTIRHQAVKAVRNGKGKGELDVTMDWIM